MATNQPGGQPNQNGAASSSGASKPPTTVEWAQAEYRGEFRRRDARGGASQASRSTLPLVGGASICPLVEGHEIVISVVPINPMGVFPSNKAAKAISKGKQPDPEG